MFMRFFYALNQTFFKPRVTLMILKINNNLNYKSMQQKKFIITQGLNTIINSSILFSANTENSTNVINFANKKLITPLDNGHYKLNYNHSITIINTNNNYTFYINNEQFYKHKKSLLNAVLDKCSTLNLSLYTNYKITIFI